MTRDEVIENLSTIAKSGMAEFFSKLSQEQSKTRSSLVSLGWVLLGFHRGGCGDGADSRCR